MQDDPRMQPEYDNAVPNWWGQPPPQYPHYLQYPQYPLHLPPRRAIPRWLLIGGIALAFLLTLGAGAVIGSSLLQTAQAAGNQPTSGFTLPFASSTAPAGPSGRPGGPGQCGSLTVSSVNGNTITAKAPDGMTVTIHTSSSTQYTRAGASASASAVTAGSVIHVDGSRNSDGSINATRIDIG
jgi:hypothetical protein